MRRFLALALLLAALLASCGGEADTAPVERVKAFVAAAEARDVDRMISFLEPDEQRDAAYQLRPALAGVTALQYRDPSYELKDNDGTTAHVQVSGIVHVERVDGPPIEEHAEQLMTLVKRDGEWYIKASEFQLPSQ